MDTGVDVPGGFGAPRAFNAELREKDLAEAHAAANRFWGRSPTVLDPMAGGGSIPLECARLGFPTLANEYNPVACSVLEATVDYPVQFGPPLADLARKWGKVWEKRVAVRLARFFPAERLASVHAYIFARTVACPTTKFATPLVPDWHLLKPRGGVAVVAAPIVDKASGTWSTVIREVATGGDSIAAPPPATYGSGKGVSLFTGEPIPSEWIKTQAQQGKMKSALYAVALKTPQGLIFRAPTLGDLQALDGAESQLAQWRADWEARNLIPTEEYPEITTDPRPRLYGMPRWADMFSPRQLLAFGVSMEELQALHPSILAEEGQALGEAVALLLAFSIDKLTNYNCVLSSWHTSHQVIRGIFDRHDFSFKSTFTEMAPIGAGNGLSWAISSCVDAYESLAKLSRSKELSPIELTQGSATALIHIADQSLDAIVVDPPYSDNVQYSELADFFYVWLKRSQGHRRPEWYASLLCESAEEAVKNDARFRTGKRTAKDAKVAAQSFYQGMMTKVFAEAHRVLRPEGVLTVMFTHKKQEAWESLFEFADRSRLHDHSDLAGQDRERAQSPSGEEKCSAIDRDPRFACASAKSGNGILSMAPCGLGSKRRPSERPSVSPAKD